MKVSVAMCTYNGERYLRRQMDSIFAQTRLPDEIVVCDDVSRDHTVQILEEYRDRGIELRIFRNEQNLGFMRNFKKALSLCTGDVIFLCDQDDFWLKEKVEKAAAVMEAHPEIQSLGTNFHLVDPQDRRLSQSRGGDNPFFNGNEGKIQWKKDKLYKIDLVTIFCNNIGPGCAQVIRREVAEDLQSCTLEEPHDFLLNRFAALRDGLYYYDEVTTCYRIHESQTCGIPAYEIARLKNDRSSMAEAYFNIFRELVYHLILGDSAKVALPPMFDDRDMMAYYDTLSIHPQARPRYEAWKQITENRRLLYGQGGKKWAAFLAQGNYNRYYAFDYSPVERLRLRAWDLAVLLKR